MVAIVNDASSIVVSSRQESEIIREVGAKFSRLCHDKTDNAEPLVFLGPGDQLVRLRGERIEMASADDVRGELAEHLRWEKSDGGPGRAPLWLAKKLMSSPPGAMPHLMRIKRRPFVWEGKLITKYGYHCPSATWLGNDQDYPEVDVPLALEMIDEALSDFPFSDDASRTHTILAMLQPMLGIRPSPLWLIEAPIAGTGKSLLAGLIGWIGTGKIPSARPLSENPEELRKVILAELIGGAEVVLFDNAADGRDLDSPTLAGALTATTWTDRLLQRSKVIEVPVQCQWIITANNPGLTTELARRTVRIRLDSGEERPWLRGGFRHDDIMEWAMGWEGPLVGAAISLVREWLDQKSQPGDARMGSFQYWADVMGGIAQCCGLTGFLGNPIADDADNESSDLAHFVELWWALKSSQEVSAGDLLGCAEEAIPYILGTGETKSQVQRLARWLHTRRQRRSGDYVILAFKVGRRFKYHLRYLWKDGKEVPGGARGAKR